MQNCPIVVCGDFNMHVDQLVDTHAVRLDLLLQSFELVQRVKESTHPAGHTVDLVITIRAIQAAAMFTSAAWYQIMPLFGSLFL